MSEYWKSTPNAWCDLCKVYYRDTSLGKQQHEQTGKHRGGVKRRLRQIYNDRDAADREKGIFPSTAGQKRQSDSAGGPSDTKRHATGNRRIIGPEGGDSLLGTNSEEIQERRRQLEQLIALGVDVPDELRRELAVAGAWEVVPTAPPLPPSPTEPEAEVSIGPDYHKQNEANEVDDEQEEEEEEEYANGPSYGSLANILNAAKQETETIAEQQGQTGSVTDGDDDDDDDEEVEAHDDEYRHFRNHIIESMESDAAAAIPSIEPAASTSATTIPTTTTKPYNHAYAPARKQNAGRVRTIIKGYPGHSSVSAVDDQISALLNMGNGGSTPTNHPTTRVKQEQNVKREQQDEGESRGKTLKMPGFRHVSLEQEMEIKSEDLVIKPEMEDHTSTTATTASVEFKKVKEEDTGEAVSKPGTPSIAFKKRTRKILKV